MFKTNVKINRPSCIVRGIIEPNDYKLIQGALTISVNTFINNSSEKEFCLSDLVGNYNAYWKEPFLTLYKAYETECSDGKKAAQKAGRDMGWILRSVLKDHPQSFSAPIKSYKNGKSVCYYRFEK